MENMKKKKKKKLSNIVRLVKFREIIKESNFSLNLGKF